MTRVHGSCVEPGGMELDNIIRTTECPDCGHTARYREWESCDSGAIERNYFIRCGHCGHFSGDDPDELY